MAAFRKLDAKAAGELARELSKAYRGTRYYLDFKTPIDLLVAAILSAQTRDETVNRLTPELFAKHKTANDYAGMTENGLVSEIRSVSFAGGKARNIIKACKLLVERHGGKVPKTIDALVALPGVGRKTANTILINAYDIVEGIPVDTWVIKLSYRMGLSGNKNPDKIEDDLKGVVPKALWHNFAYVVKRHGKEVCKTIPQCGSCPVQDLCPKNGVTKGL